MAKEELFDSEKEFQLRLDLHKRYRVLAKYRHMIIVYQEHLFRENKLLMQKCDGTHIIVEKGDPALDHSSKEMIREIRDALKRRHAKPETDRDIDDDELMEMLASLRDDLQEAS